MKSIVESCLSVLEGREHEFIARMIGSEPRGDTDHDSVMLVKALAHTYPQSFVESVGVYLHDHVEVA